MKRSTISTLLIVGLTAGFMGTTASAQSADFLQLQDSVKVGLSSLQVNTDTLGSLTVNQIAQLQAILDSDDSNDIKAQNANNVIAEATTATPMATSTPETQAQLDAVKANLDRVGVVYSGLEGLTADQLAQLTQVFDTHSSDDAAAKQAAEAIILAISAPANLPSTNEGVIQLEEQVSVKLAALGITPPPKGSLTFDQVGQLATIFDNGASQADQKAAASTVLGID